MSERLFVDTAFIQAILNQRDQYHSSAKRLLPRVTAATQVWTTEAILVEIGNALAGINRKAASHFIRQCYQTENMHILPVTTPLFERGLTLYESRADKTWGLTDCISFVVMQDEGLVLAATTDRHFIQAGFRALLTET
jgi:hypothetical protein